MKHRLASLLSFAVLLLLAVTPPLTQAAPGDVDSSWPSNLQLGPDDGGYLSAAAVQPDGKTIIAGFFTSVLGVPRNNIARLNANGTLDMTFDPNAGPSGNSDFTVNCLAVQADGKVLIGGGFTTLKPNGAAKATPRNFVARLNPTGTLDPSFDPNPQGGLYVNAVAVQPDGKVLIAGEFNGLKPNGATDVIVRNKVARFNADGTFDPSFQAYPNNTVLSIALQSDGKLVLGGYFSAYRIGAASPTPRTGIMRVNADGSLDAGFDPNPSGANPIIVYSVAVQANGKVLLGGLFTSLQPNGAATATTRNAIARVNADGTLDASYDPNSAGGLFSGRTRPPEVRTVALQADGKVLLAGFFTAFQANGAASPTSRNAIARVNADGTLDTTFALNPPAPSGASGRILDLQADGRVLTPGRHLLNDSATQSLKVPSSSQVLWSRAGAAPELADTAFEVSTDGGAHWTALGTGTRVATSANWQLTNLTLPERGMLRARGRKAAGLASSGLVEQVAAFPEPGDLDSLDANIVGGTVLASVTQPDGKLILAGNFTSVLGTARNNIARLNKNGTLDSDFDPNANGDVNCVIVQPDGGIVLGGAFTSLQPNGAAATTTRNYLARVMSDGSLDTDFDPNANGVVRALALQSDGQLVVGGNFTTLQPSGAMAATTRNHLARLKGDGSLDANFDPNADGAVLSLALQPGGSVIAGGDFTSLQPNGAASAATRNHVARLNSDGTLDNSFDPNANGAVRSVALHRVSADKIPGSFRIVLGGDFTTLGAGATPRAFIAQVQSDGSLDTAFDPKANASVRSIAATVDFKLLVVGDFTTFQPNGAAATTARGYVARLSEDGSLDATFDPKADASVRFVTAQADGKELLGGDFTSLQPNGAPAPTSRNHFARLQTDPATQTLSIEGLQSGARWIFAGTAPELASSTLDFSGDGGSTWIPLGVGFRSATTAFYFFGFGAPLPNDGTLRARGVVAGGTSSGLIEQLLDYDLATDAPLLSSPTDGTATKDNLTITFNLPEEALPGSVKLSIGGTVLTLAASEESKGSHTFVLDITDPTASPKVASMAFGPIAGGDAPVTLSYQDLDGNLPAHATRNVFLAINAPRIAFLSGAEFVAADPHSAAFEFAADYPPQFPITFAYLLDGVPGSGPVTSPATVSGLDDGYHTFTVVVTSADLPNAPIIDGYNRKSVDFLMSTGGPGYAGGNPKTLFVVTPQSPVPQGKTLTATFGLWRGSPGSDPLTYGVEEVINGVLTTVVPQGASTAPTFTLPVGIHQVRGRVADNNSMAAVTPFVTIAVTDAKAPVVKITAPADKTVPGAFTISGTVREETGISAFVVEVNGVNVPLDAPLNFIANTDVAWSVSNVSPENGPNVIVVQATDSGGRVTTATKTVTFVNSRPALAGNYEALLVPAAIPPTTDAMGVVSIMVTESGSFTGKVLVNGASITIGGFIDNAGTARFNPLLGPTFELVSKKIGYGTLPGLTVSDPAGLSGQLDAPNEPALFAGKKAPYSSATPVPAAMLNAGVKGVYNVTFPANTDDPLITPQGDGFFVLTLAKTGAITVAGTLADGSAYKAGGNLRSDGSVALYAPLYKNLGAIEGELTFEDRPDSDVSGANFLWLRPQQDAATAYVAGWPNGFEVDAVGTKFTKPASLDFGQGAVDNLNGNATVVFSDGALTGSVNYPVGIDPVTGKVVTVPSKNAPYKLTLTATSGLFSGTFTHTDSTKPKFNGILLDKGANKGGFGFFLSTPTSSGGDSQSGGVSLEP